MAPFVNKPYAEAIHDPALLDRDVANAYLGRLGLDPDSLRYMWEEAGYGQLKDAHGQPYDDSMSVEEYAASSIQRIVALEKWQPGSAREINEHNRIYSFGRVPLNSLRHQYQRRQQGGHYRRRVWAGVVARDWNGALLDSMACLDRAWDRVDNDSDTDLIIKEFHSIDTAIEELERDAFEWKKDRQNPPYAQFIGLFGHGDPDGILVDSWESGRSIGRDYITYTDIEGAVGSALLSIANPDTVVLLDSCSGARGERNIARAVHERTGLHVIGAKKDIETLSLRFTARGREALTVTPGFYTATPQGKKYVRRRSPAVHYRRQPKQP